MQLPACPCRDDALEHPSQRDVCAPEVPVGCTQQRASPRLEGPGATSGTAAAEATTPGTMPDAQAETHSHSLICRAACAGDNSLLSYKPSRTRARCTICGSRASCRATAVSARIDATRASSAMKRDSSRRKVVALVASANSVDVLRACTPPQALKVRRGQSTTECHGPNTTRCGHFRHMDTV